jgi:hypothetical protein
MTSTIKNDLDFGELAQASYSNLNRSMTQAAYIDALS